MRLKRATCLALCGLAAVTASWARKAGELPKPGINFFSKQQDIQVGQSNAQQVLQQYQVVRDQSLQNYIRRVGEKLAATPEARQSGFPFNFTLLNVAQVNAFALPGGPMFIFTGLIKTTDNEAQLMGVMAHEMSHVILRHGTHEASKASGVQIVANLLGAAAGSGSLTSQLTRLGLGLGANSLILKFSRTAESEADAMGVHLMAEAGYNPIEMARFFEKLASQGNQGIQFLSDHPNPDNRERAIEEEIQVLPRRDYTTDSPEFPRIKAAVQALPPAPAAPNKQGALAPSPNVPLPAAPAVAWRQFRAPRFTVSYPGNWSAEAAANGSRWTIVPPDGFVKGASGSAQMGYGALASYFSPTHAGLGTGTLELVGYLHGERPDLQLSTAPQQNVRVDGAEGMLTKLENRSLYGGSEIDALLTVSRPEGLFYMLCIAPQATFPQLQGTFQQMLNSIRFSN